MKKLLTGILLICLFLAGCATEKSEKTAKFYYPRADYGQNSTESVIAQEERSQEGLSTITLLLNNYFRGPLDSQLVNPFPKECKVVNVYVMGNVTLVTLTDNFSQLEGLELLLACASLSRTVSDITGTPIVQISCDTAKIDGKNHITIGPETIHYLDTAHLEPEQLPTEE